MTKWKITKKYQDHSYPEFPDATVVVSQEIKEDGTLSNYEVANTFKDQESAKKYVVGESYERDES